ncbi:TerB family tellurite resistance protein [Rhodoferax sp.]|uniref:tellurite resistance TerB family protein n=1 Tax=Rhodoferax sp. TaxID=50421 RepID=UPI00374DF2B0
MLQTLKDLFDSLIAPAFGPSPADREQALQLATAVLLVEVVRADPQMEPAERQAVVTALQQKFALADSAAAQLVAQAEQAAKTAYDYHQFTASINDYCTQPQKVRIVESMWQVAYADAYLDAQENHLISKIAGLLYVTHGEYIGAKMRAKEAAGLVS